MAWWDEPGQPGWQRSSASPSRGDENAVPGDRMTMGAGSQLCALLSWLAWVPLLQIPLLTAGRVQPLWDMLYCDAFGQKNSANLLYRNRENAMVFFFFFLSFLLCPVDEVQPIFLTYLKTLILMSDTVFDYLPQLSAVTWKTPTAFVGPKTGQGKPNIRTYLLPFLLCIGCWSSAVLEANTMVLSVCCLHPKQGRSQTSQAVQLHRIAKEDWEPCLDKHQKIRC